MIKTPAIAIFDVGKTNKKLFLFDEDYQILFERSAKFIETVDEDGYPCDNLDSLSFSVFDSLREIFRLNKFDIRAINFSTYGASFVYLDENGRTVAPLYNYLKPYPENLKKQFYDIYGGEEEFSYRTASPVLGSLNSGMQLYRLKYEKPEVFARIKHALHLPQYLSFLLSGQPCADITSIGCHTNLWDFAKNAYHDWVTQEGIVSKLAPLLASNQVLPAVFPGNGYCVGVGLHDSSAALIPYLVNFTEPFILISTGTWCISFNPFNDSPLTKEELVNDCLCYLTYKGKPVKASRLFAGYEHEQQTKRIAEHFHLHAGWYRNVNFDPRLIIAMHSHGEWDDVKPTTKVVREFAFARRDLNEFQSADEAYHQLMYDIVSQQFISTQMVLAGGASVRRIFVDGGFSKNVIYMNCLAYFFPKMEVFAASVAQATAVGTALSIHAHWNTRALPNDIMELKYYSAKHPIS